MSQDVKVYRSLELKRPVGIMKAGTCLPSSTYEALAYMVDGKNINLAKGYSSSFMRKYVVDICGDTGSTDCTGNVNLGAIKGRVIAGTTQTNCGISGVLGVLDVGTVDLQGNFNGACGVLDFYGDCTLGTGASCYGAGLVAVVWNEATTTLGAGAVLSGVDIVENGAVGSFGSGSRNPGINIRGNFREALYAAITTIKTTGQNIVDLQVTDSVALASGYSRGIYINWTKTGAQTGGAVNPLAIDFAATTANCTEVALESHYITQTGNKLTGNVFGWQIYCEDLGTGVANVCLIDLGIVAGTHTASRLAFFRAKQHSTTKRMDEVFYIEGTSNYCATNLFTFCGCDTANDLLQSGTTLSGGIVGRLRVLVESTPGAGTTTMFIPLYTS